MNRPGGLAVIVCGAGPAGQVGRLVDLAQPRGWDVGVIATPAGLPFLDCDALEAQTGRPVRSRYRTPDEPRVPSLPRLGAIIVAPATLNTLVKWALGIADNYALGLLAESHGFDIPVAAIPFVNSALAANPAFGRAVTELRDRGVHVVHGPGELEPHPPGSGGQMFDTFPWARALDRIEGPQVT